MAAGLDELIDFVLAEIALCGTQGTYQPGAIGPQFEPVHHHMFDRLFCRTMLATTLRPRRER